jgi:hypothetical protein
MKLEMEPSSLYKRQANLVSHIRVSRGFFLVLSHSNRSIGEGLFHNRMEQMHMPWHSSSATGS